MPVRSKQFANHHRDGSRTDADSAERRAPRRLPAIAVISDIHANIEALEAVIADARAVGAKKFICLGDIVGYGAAPAECVRRVREICLAVLLGNHDIYSATDMELKGIHPHAKAGALFSRRHLSDDDKRYLLELPLIAHASAATFVHASLPEPDAFDYMLYPEVAEPHIDSQETSLSFFGHTHLPSVWFKDEIGEMRMGIPADKPITLPEHMKFAVGAGSVGMPRDGDPRACYLVWRPSDSSVEFRRVEYDIDTAQSRMTDARLPKALTNRLATAH